jgi:transcriptional regulator with XRE-family HTH domain
MAIEREGRIGQALREARQQRAKQDPRGFSLRAVAARLGVSATYLSLVERGTERPTEAFLRRACSELGLDPEALLPLAGRLAADVAQSLIERPELVEAVRVLREMPEPELRRAVRRIRDGAW